MSGRHACRNLAALLLVTQFLTGCSSGNPLLVYLPEFVLKHSDSAFDSLVKDPASLDARLRRGLNPSFSNSEFTPLIVRSIQLDAPHSFATLVRYRANLGHTDRARHNAWYYALSHPSRNFVQALEQAGQPVVLKAATQLPNLVAELKKKQLIQDRLPIMLRSGLDWDAASASDAHTLDLVLSPSDRRWFESMVGAGASPVKVAASALAPYLAFNEGPFLEFLLRAGIDPNAKTPEGKTLLYMAVEQENPHGAELLQATLLTVSSTLIRSPNRAAPDQPLLRHTHRAITRRDGTAKW